MQSCLLGNARALRSLIALPLGAALLGALMGGCVTPGRDRPLDSIVEVVASPDGKVAAVATNYDEVALFDLAPLRFKTMLTRESDRRPKPRSFMCAVKLQSGTCVPGPRSPQLAFAHGGETLIAAGVGGNVVGWDLRSGAETFRVPLAEGVLDVAFSPSGGEFATAGPNLVLWAASNGARKSELQIPTGVHAMSVAIAPEGRVILVGLSNGSIAVYDAESRELLRTLEGHVAPVFDLAFSPDGTAFASTAGQHDPQLWKKEAAGEFGKGERAIVGAEAVLGPSLERGQALGVFVWLLGGVNSARIVGAPALGPAPVGTSAEAYLARAARAMPMWCGPRVAFSPDGRYFASSASLMQNPGSLADPKIPIFLTDLKRGDTKAMQHTSCVVGFTADSRFVIAGPVADFVAAPTFWDVETFQRADLPEIGK